MYSINTNFYFLQKIFIHTCYIFLKQWQVEKQPIINMDIFSYHQFLCEFILVADTVSVLVSSWWLAAACLCSCDSLTCVLGLFWPFLDLWYCLMASTTSGTVHCCLVRASCSVNAPSRVLLTPWHTAVLRSSSPISCTTLRRYFWVSLMHWTSEEGERRVKDVKLPGRVTFHWRSSYPEWSAEAGSECSAGRSG